VDSEFHKNPQPTVYDVRISLPDPLRAALSQILTSQSYPATLRSIAKLNDDVALLVQAIAHSKSKHMFLTGLSKDPASFVKRWISSQKRDLEIIMGETGRGAEDGGEEWRRGGEGSVWESDNVRESVNLLLAKAK
jgi:SWI/SNF-related matrix-associated actin-dependent regulator of chromatin subfamily D